MTRLAPHASRLVAWWFLLFLFFLFLLFIMNILLHLDKLFFFFSVFFVVCILVIIAIMLDLWDGVYTAKKTNQRILSHKMRITFAKVIEYWRYILISFLVDCLGVFFSFYILPFVTLIFGASLIVVEGRSMFEHAKRRRSHMADVPDIINDIIAAVDKRDAKKIIDQLKSRIESSNNNHDNYENSH